RQPSLYIHFLLHSHHPNRHLHSFPTRRSSDLSIPKLQDRFWLNLIGKGYPSPNRWFRWCTERMKINPTNDYILATVSKHGKAIIDRKSTRLNSSHLGISYAVFCLKKKNKKK